MSWIETDDPYLDSKHAARFRSAERHQRLTSFPIPLAELLGLSMQGYRWRGRFWIRNFFLHVLS